MLAVLIPALDPPASFPSLVESLVADPRVSIVLVVDDGSAAACAATFAAVSALPRAHLLRHPRNLGKGAALKSGIRYLTESGIAHDVLVTADADGQHRPDDILRVAEAARHARGALVLGVREVGASAPLRSRIGNGLTRVLFQVLVGEALRDTQTGLRAMPSWLARDLAQVTGTGYEYELNVLIWCHQCGVPIVQEPIASVYLDGNRESHFRPVRDSLRIYSVLLRFGAVSVASAGVDNLVFLAGLAGGLGVPAALLLARGISAGVNYPVVRRWVFPPAGNDAGTGLRYLTLLALNLCVSGTVVAGLVASGALPAEYAKALTETLLFLPNFVLQRDVVFKWAPESTRTDWTSYYTSVPVTARLTRRYTARMVARALTDVGATTLPVRRVVELGGARSCVLDAVCRLLEPDSYTVVDSNAFGLASLANWTPPGDARTSLRLVESDVRDYRGDGGADLAFSIGLIEHFDPEETARVLDRHFELVRRGGVVLVSYPTPTPLYRLARGLLEGLKLWRFPDERPLGFAEAARAAAAHGDLLWRRTLWPMLLTQELLVFRKR